MIFIDYKDARPLFEQIAERLEVLILKGVLEANSKIPSVRTMAMDLSINPNTIQKAYNLLERKGYLYSVKGRGNFVSESISFLSEKKAEIWRKADKLLIEAGNAGIERDELLEYMRKVGESK